MSRHRRIDRALATFRAKAIIADSPDGIRKKGEYTVVLTEPEMDAVVEISVEQIMPDREGVLLDQGIPPGVSPRPAVIALYESAEQIFLNLAAPVGTMVDIDVETFEGIYPGNGSNAPDTPLETIFPRATHLALFAFTLGMEISHEIEEQLRSNGLALGYMLDAVASYSVGKASQVAEERFLNRLLEEGKIVESDRVLLYSPGYCGWHISSQRKLFDYLKPEGIGIRLSERFLMEPLKSISGVLLAGEAGIHRFPNNYPFCGTCMTKTCRERMKVDRCA